MATDHIKRSLPGAEIARTLVIAGSGLGGFVKSITPDCQLDYADIPGVGASTVTGHAGKLILGRLGASSAPALVMAGRRHIYEGLSPADAVLLPQLILQGFPNVKSIIISNAAGGLNPSFSVGDLMLLSDHINWMFRNPLRGAEKAVELATESRNYPVYDPALRNLAQETALKLGIGLREGTYIAMTGPSYETRSEITMARHLFGADAVGMSTVPEATMAAAAGRRVLGISFISNLLLEPAPLTHEEVVANSALVEEKFSRLVIALVEKLHTH